MLAWSVTALDVAAISALAAVVAPLTTLVIARGSWTHERQSARDARVYADARAAYEDILELMFLTDELMRARQPIITPGPPEPDFPNDDELRRRMARISTIGAEPIVKEIEAAFDSYQGWRVADMTIRDLERLNEKGDDMTQARKAAFDAHQAFVEKTGEIEKLIREDVRR